MSSKTDMIMEVLERNLRSIWEGDVDAYQETTSENLSFFEWYISPQRIDGLDFHLRELRVHKDVMSGDQSEGSKIEHEILQPRIQDFGATVVVTYTLLIRAVTSVTALVALLKESCMLPRSPWSCLLTISWVCASCASTNRC